jgi:hypothetical protein
LSEADAFTEPVLRLGDPAHPIWLTVGNKFAPFGYVPAEIRAAPAYVLLHEGPALVETSDHGALDSVGYDGKVDLAPDGSARMRLFQRFHGKYAMGLRAVLSQVPERQLHDMLESRLLGRVLRGARLAKFDLSSLSSLDEPLSIAMDVEMSSFAEPIGDGLVISPPFAPGLTQLATLPARQTPLLISEASHQIVALEIHVPTGARIESPPGKVEVKDGDRRVTVRDSVGPNGVLVLSRTIDLPAGRIQPADYGRFVRFAQKSDDALSRSIRIRLR